MNSMSLFENDVFEWSQEHIEANKAQWKKLTPQHKLLEFNRKWYNNHFKTCSVVQLEYYANLKIPHFSKWAHDAIK